MAGARGANREMTRALEGLRVLDFTTGMAGALATMVLADNGAEVILVETRPGAEEGWTDDPTYLLWHRGKKSVLVDLETSAGRERLQRLMEHADVLVESLDPGLAERLGIGFESAAASNPSLVYCSISAFGRAGPYAHLTLSDGIVNAKTGRMRDQVGHQGDRPTYRAVNDTSYHTAMFCVQAILAGLRVAAQIGQGQQIETSLLNGTTAPNNPWLRFEGCELPPDLYPNQVDRSDVLNGALALDRKEGDPTMAIPSQLCTPCLDGKWIMHAHPQPKLFMSWIGVIGFDWIWDDERYKGAPTFFPSDDDRIRLNLMIFDRMKEKTSSEWIELYQQNPDCAGDVMQSTHEALYNPHFHEKHVIEVEDPRVGRMLQVGPLVAMSETPAQVRAPAPLRGQHTVEVLDKLSGPRKRQRPSPNPATALRPPLDGVVVLELATWVATPFAGALLADLGARVIKIEPLSGDPMRGRFTNEDNAVRVNQGKESIAVNLQAAEGQAILRRLVQQADIVVHNYRPGVPERLGLDYGMLRALKPDLVYVCASSYGSSGPDARRAAFNPTVGAFSGNSVFQSGEGNVPIGDQSPDPIAGSAVATAALLGLTARDRLGIGQYLETSMALSCVYCNSDDAFDYKGKAPRKNPDKEQLGIEATYRLYRAKDGWVFVDAVADTEFATLCVALGLGELPTVPRFSTKEARYESREVLGELLAEQFTSRTADEWESHLTSAGVACARADGLGYRRFIHDDPHARAVRLMVPTSHWAFSSRTRDGRYWRHRPVADFSLTMCEEGRPYAALGEHTETILARAGYSPSQILELEQMDLVASAGHEGDRAPAR